MERLFNLDAQLLFDACIMAIGLFVLFNVLYYCLFDTGRNMLENRKPRVVADPESDM